MNKNYLKSFVLIFILNALKVLGKSVGGSWVRILLGAYALRQGILSTIVSLDPGVVNGYPAGNYSL